VDATLVTAVIGAIVALVGSGGVVFAALRFNREETGKIVDQQTIILDNMRTLNDELQEALERTRDQLKQTRTERDELRHEVEELRIEVTRLRHAIDQQGLGSA
jgi:peptidoglycan hydrolase CwlO-like protein